HLDLRTLGTGKTTSWHNKILSKTSLQQTLETTHGQRRTRHESMEGGGMAIGHASALSHE
ncbi:hypothetical protein, partial [Actinomadura sp. 9N407]|uniref:hypothetical protein n=1 Tax=Actinomadura sp. 9N407 TaxID=3375154 RepID=UPI00379040BF